MSPKFPAARIRRRRSAQRGIALFVSLALLLSLTVAATIAAQTATLELRMARYAQDERAAFHRAERALAQAEAALAAGAAPADGAGIEWLARIAASSTPPVTVDIYRVTVAGIAPGGAAARLQSTYGVASGDSPLAGRLSWIELELGD